MDSRDRSFPLASDLDSVRRRCLVSSSASQDRWRYSSHSLSCHSWTIVYDTIYACQDREDDRRVGIKSCALLFGSYVREVLSILSVVVLTSLVCTGYLLQQGLGFAMLSCGGTLLHTVWQLATWDEANLNDHRAKFEVSSTTSLPYQ